MKWDFAFPVGSVGFLRNSTILQRVWCPLFQRAAVPKLVFQNRRQNGEKEKGTSGSKMVQEEGMGIFQRECVAVRSSPGTGELQFLGHKCISRIFSRNIWAVLWIIRI